ncbi:MAG: hypothetical protein Q4G27_07950 [Flavobacteriaceae bacterium]|nr:hypothetical protein [Flavobacteriaceae bacterium]
MKEHKMNSGYKNRSQRLIITAFLCFLAVAITGVWMRALPWITSKIPFANLLHAHSHTAMLGWAFLMIVAGIIAQYQLNSTFLRRSLFVVIFAIVGMFAAFIYQSYGAISIGFSTLYVLSAYVILIHINKKIPATNSGNPLLKRSIIWFFISTLGIWAMGPVSSMLGKTHWLYDICIQIFLHFQINGWLFYAVLGLLLKNGEMKPKFIQLFDISLILTAFLPFYWIEQFWVFYGLNALGSMLQFLVLLVITHSIYRLPVANSMERFGQYTVILFILIKAISQCTAVVPEIAASIVSQRYLILTFLHAVLIGIVSIGLIWNMLRIKLLQIKPTFHIGFLLFFIGFMITEILLLIQGFGYYAKANLVLLLLFSCVMLLGILGMLISLIFIYSSKK